jgi:hypothetical protein
MVVYPFKVEARVVSKPSEGKVMDFESKDGLGTEQKALRVEPQEQ